MGLDLLLQFADGDGNIAALGDELLSGPGIDRFTWGCRLPINGISSTPRPKGEAPTEPARGHRSDGR